MRRAIYERLESILPGNAYVLQHRSILERDLNNPDLAMRYARESLKIEPKNVTLKNTLGLALEFAGRTSDDPLRRQGLLSEANKIFDEGIRREPRDPYGYVGKVSILRQEAKSEKDPSRRAALRARVLSLLEEANETTDESPIIAGQLNPSKV
ncbi:MAG TPA: hypothetical protein VIU62_18970 [Chloroflexota bacterium]|jgi:tetratricopeptide (TPR) repeat protein